MFNCCIPYICKILNRKANKKHTEDSEIPSRNFQILLSKHIFDLDKT